MAPISILFDIWPDRDPASVAAFVGYTERAANASVAKRLQIQGINTYMNFGTKEIFRTAASGATQDAALVLEAFARTMAQSITRLRETRIKTLLDPVGRSAVDSVVREYKSKHQRSLSGYREGNDRLSGGRLLKALNSTSMYRVAQDGIFFINQAHLDSQAAHWYRLNFGAGGKGRDTPAAKQYRMRFLGQDVGLDFRVDSPPSAGFTLPPGFWGRAGGSAQSVQIFKPWTPLPEGRKGQDMFFFGERAKSLYANSRNQRIAYKKKHGPEADPRRFYPTASKGIQGSRYLDAGISRLTDGLPVAYTALMNEWLREAETKGTGPFVTIAADASVLSSARTQIDREIGRIMDNRRLKGLGRGYGF